ncbi:MAG: hypothetical protein ACLRZZ_06645 [Enterocloster sp.]
MNGEVEGYLNRRIDGAVSTRRICWRRSETLGADQKYEGYVKMSEWAGADGSAVEGTEIANGATTAVSYELGRRADKGPELIPYSM